MVTVEDLYRHFGVLADAKDKASDHEEDYKAILGAVKGGTSEKRLASQFIIRFFKHFPHLMVDSINAMFDLCEDEDIMIRKQAIKDLPQVCRTSPDQVAKITEALTQLQPCDDPTELTLIYSSLVAITKINPKEALKGLFVPLTGEDSEVDEATEATLKFIALKLKTFQADWLDHACEEFMVEEFKKLLSDARKEEFILIIDIMKQLTVMETLAGRQQLVDIIVAQAELDQPFNAGDTEDVDRLVQCGRQALSLFSKNVHSTRFVAYMCDRVVPALTSDASLESGCELDLLKLLADVTEHPGDVEGCGEKLLAVYNKLITYMPEPPEEATDPDATKEEPSLQFSHAECLLFTFHRLARKQPEFLTDDAHAHRLKNFKLRLQYFARGVQTYIKQLRAALQDKIGADLKTDENKIKVMALKITTNINCLVKDLLHTPPLFKAIVTPSWAPVTVKGADKGASAGDKRTPITFESDPTAKKQPRQGQTIYAPPKDKYSTNYNTGRGRGGRGRGFRSY